MSDKLKNLLIRAASGAVLIGLFLGAVLWSSTAFWVFMLLIMLGCQTEFYRLCRKAGISPQRTMGLSGGAALYFAFFAVFHMMKVGSEMTSYFTHSALIAAVFFFALLPASFVCELWRKSETPIANIAATIAGVVYVALPMSLLMLLPLLLNGGVWSPAVMLGFMCIVWGNDVFAYLVGCTIGRHKMFERISPKKSWEGFVGGVAGAVLIGWGVSAFVGGSAVVWCILALITAVTGVAGDLVESMFKRSVDVKDSGNILPGHGGFLDRFDALLISVPFAFIYLLIYL